jgi:hypothetical protein
MSNQKDLFHLPDHLLAVFLQTWTDVIDLTKFDTAMCCSRDRFLFLETISTAPFCHNGKLKEFDSFQKHMDYVDWLLLRSISVESILLAPEKLSDLRKYKTILRNLLSLRTSYTPNLGNFIGFNCQQIRSLDISNYSSDEEKAWQVDDQSLESILLVIDNLELLNIGGCTLITNLAMTQLCTLCPELSSLLISGCFRISSKAHVMISAKFKEIKRLEFCCFKGKINDNDMKIVFTNCIALEHLVIKECDVITDHTIKLLATNGGGMLHHFECTYGHLLSDVSICAIIQANPILEYLMLHECNVSDQILRDVSEYNLNIAELHLNYCSGITNTGLNYLNKHQRVAKISTLSITGCNKISDMAIIELSRKCKMLENFDISDCGKLTNTCGEEIIKCCDKLTNFKFDGTKIEPTKIFAGFGGGEIINSYDIRFGFEYTGFFSHSLTTLHGVKNVDVRSTECFATSTILSRLIRCGNNLLCVSLHGLSNLNDKLIELMCQKCPNLIRVSLLKNQRVTKKSVALFGSVFANKLQMFEISHILDLSDDILCAFFFSQTRLETIYIASCGSITDASMKVLARACHQKLLKLTLICMPLITKATMDVMHRDCNLRFLNIINC